MSNYALDFRNLGSGVSKKDTQMAKSIRFSGFSKSDGSRLFSIEPDWWSVTNLQKSVKLNWASSNVTGSYRDDDADISVEEARVLHEQFKPEILGKIAYNVNCMDAEKLRHDESASTRLAGYTEYVAQLKAELGLIEAAVGEDASKFSHFHICVFEWESGY